MAEGWRVAEMILTVQVLEKMGLEAQIMASPPAGRTVVLNSRVTQATNGSSHSIRPGPLWGIRS